MAGKSFALTFLLFLFILTVLLWKFETNFFGPKGSSLVVYINSIRSMKETAKREISTLMDSNLKTNENRSYTIHHKKLQWLIVYWSTYFQVKLDLHLSWKQGDCPVACEVSSDHSRANEADAFVVHARDSRMIPPNKSVPWILQTQENPVYTPSLTNPNFMSKFNLLQSYRLDSDFPDPTFTKPNVTPPVPFKDKDTLQFTNKTVRQASSYKLGVISWSFPNCVSTCFSLIFPALSFFTKRASRARSSSSSSSN